MSEFTDEAEKAWGDNFSPNNPEHAAWVGGAEWALSRAAVHDLSKVELRADVMTADEAIESVVKRPGMYGLVDKGDHRSMKAERDAALAAVERVRDEARSVVMGENDPRTGWNMGLDYLANRTLAALDGVPERPVQPSSTADEGKIADVLTDHVLMEPNGGTSSWSWCECSCGFEVKREGATRDYVEKLARKHQARAVVEAIGGEGL